MNKIILYLVVVLLTFLVFMPALLNGFVNWDDPEYILHNAMTDSLSGDSIKNIFTRHLTGKYHPLSLLVLAVEKYFFGTDPAGYHAVSIFLHMINSVLAFWFIFSLTHRQDWAFIVSLLFGIHPFHVEPVAWATSQKDMLFALFYLGGCLSYLMRKQTGSRQITTPHLLTVVLFILSLFSKAVAVSFPFTLLLIDYYRNRKIRWSDWSSKIVLFTLSLGFGLATYIASRVANGFPNTGIYSMKERVLYSSYAVTQYLLKTLLPLKLSAHYPPPTSFQFLMGVCAGSVLFLAVVLWANRKNHTVIFGLFFFLAMISPVLHLIVINDSVIYDRFMYVPAIGLFLIMAYIFTVFMKLLESRRRSLAQALKITAWIYVLILCVISVQRVRVWNNSQALWVDVIRNYPNSYVAYNNLGHYYQDLRMFNEAELMYKKMTEVLPGNTDGYINLASLYLILNRIDESADQLARASALDENNSTVYNLRGVIFGIRQDYNKAADDFTRALSIDQRDAKIYYNRGTLYLGQGNYAAALADFEEALKLEPDNDSTKQRIEFVKDKL